MKKSYRLIVVTGLLIIIISFPLYSFIFNFKDFGTPSLGIEDAFPKLKFRLPVDLQSPDDGKDLIYIVEQEGKIVRFENSIDVDKYEVVLDITDRVESGGEKGLLGLAFHPDFKNNGRIFVDYTKANPLRTVIAEFNISLELNKINQNEKIILEINQPFGNHNGGQVAFGTDGYLYIAVGDGGLAFDPDKNGQNKKTLLGSILRIDINDPNDTYGIPADNPFANNDQGYKEEIFAYGLRNPWRMSFDTQTGKLWTGDVGQNKYEEINIIEIGGNYGWGIMEGFHCIIINCDKSGLINPVYEYDHSVGISITGGYVYRGNNFEELSGKYIYGDFGSGRIWGLLVFSNGTVKNELLVTSDLSISSFGVSSNNEILIVDYSGNIYRFQR